MAEELQTIPRIEEHEGVRVVRDDIFAGGTKAQVLAALFGAAREYVYASPAYGYAQVALAHAAKAAGKRATVFVAARKQRHERTATAAAYGAKIVEVPCGYMTVVQKRARDYCAVSGAVMLPFGLDHPVMIEALANRARSLSIQPEEVWTVAGTGVLTRSLQRAWPNARFKAVRVGMETNAGSAEVLTAPEKFEDDAKVRPPFPSCSNYDAKAWRFIRAQASPGAVFWNVAA